MSADHNHSHRKREKSNLSLVMLLLVGLGAAGGGWYWHSRRADNEAASQATQVRSVLHLETFVLNLSGTDEHAYLRVVFEATLASADHLYYRDYLQRLPELTYMCSCQLAPIDAPALLQLDLSIAFPLIDLLLGGEGKGKFEPRDVTEIEEQILESVVQIICRELGVAWQALGLEFRFDRRQQAANALRLMPPDDKTLALSFGITMPEASGTFSLAVPAAVSTALLRKMTADWAYRKPQGPTESKAQVKARVSQCSFPVELSLMGLKVPAGELFSLHPGKLLVLEHPIEVPVTLVAGEQPLFEAFLMRQNRKRVARLAGYAPKPKSKGKGLP